MIAMSNPNFQNPPWVYGPKEVNDWIDATYPTKKKKISEQDRKKVTLKNLHIKFDFDVKHIEIEPSSIPSKLRSKILGDKFIEEDFDIFKSAEIILRAFAKAKFRNTARIMADGNVLYDHPEDRSDLRETIKGLDDFKVIIEKSKVLEIVAILSDINKCTANIVIKKVHSEKDHTVEIKMKGNIRGDLYKTFYNYLNGKLGIKEQN